MIPTVYIYKVHINKYYVSWHVINKILCMLLYENECPSHHNAINSGTLHLFYGVIKLMKLEIKQLQFT